MVSTCFGKLKKYSVLYKLWINSFIINWIIYIMMLVKDEKSFYIEYHIDSDVVL